jgi:hypothetical protein
MNPKVASGLDFAFERPLFVLFCCVWNSCTFDEYSVPVDKRTMPSIFFDNGT